MHALGKTHAFSADIEVLVCFVVYKTYFYVFMLPGSDHNKQHILSTQRKDRPKLCYSDIVPGI